MGRQVTYYLLPEDLRELERRIASAGDFVVIAAKSESEKLTYVEGLSAAIKPNEWLTVYLARAMDVKSVEMHYVSAQGYWLLDATFAPVIEFDRCYSEGRVLRRGRAYVVDRYYDDRGEVVEKNPAFRAWATKVFASVKQYCRKRDSDYIGPNVDRWLSTSEGAELR